MENLRVRHGLARLVSDIPICNMSKLSPANVAPRTCGPFLIYDFDSDLTPGLPEEARNKNHRDGGAGVLERT